MRRKLVQSLMVPLLVILLLFLTILTFIHKSTYHYPTTTNHDSANDHLNGHPTITTTMTRHPFFVLVEPFQGDAITCKSFLFFLKIYKIVKFPQDARQLELSVCYHTPTSHFRTPPFLSSYHKHLTHSSESTTYSIPPCNNGKNSSKPLTHLKCSASLPNPAPLPKQKISSPSTRSL